MMGTGKSTVGEILSQKLDRSFIDIDHHIEKSKNKSINDIFKKNGEQYFRKIESQTLLESNADIVSCGGGIILDKQNRVFLQSNGLIIHLICTIDNIIKRVGNTSSRPLLINKNLKKVLNELKKKRIGLYKKIANITVSTNNIEPSEVCNQIIEKIQK